MAKLKLPTKAAEIRLIQREISESLGITTGKASEEFERLDEKQQAEVFRLASSPSIESRTQMKRLVITASSARALRAGKKEKQKQIAKQLADFAGQVNDGRDEPVVGIEHVKKALQLCLADQKTPDKVLAEWQALAAKIDQDAEGDDKTPGDDETPDDTQDETKPADDETPGSEVSQETDSQPPQESGLLTAGQLAKQLEIDGGSSAVKLLVGEGMPETREGNKRRYDPAVCKAWIAERPAAE